MLHAAAYVTNPLRYWTEDNVVARHQHIVTAEIEAY